MRKIIPKKVYLPVIGLALFAAFIVPALAATYDLTGTRFLLRGFVDIPELSSAPGTPDTTTGRVYTYNDGLYFKDDAGTATNLLSPSVSTAWDDIGAPDASDSISFGTYTATLTGASTAADQFNFINTGNFGDVSVVKIQQTTGDPTDGTLLEVTSGDTNTDGIVVSNTTADLTAGSTLLRLDFTDDGDADGTFIECRDNAAGDTKFKVADDGDTTIAGSLTVSEQIYQAAIASAAAGNTNLTIDAAGTGTITLGSTSTGKVATDNAVELFGATDIGDADTDTLTIIASIDGGVLLDDGVTHSPTLTLKDATDETAVIQKQDGGDTHVTVGAARDFEIVTGNLAVGNGSPGTAAMDGEDFYCEGDSEFDGTMTVDGAMTANGAVAMNSTLALSENVTFTMAADEYFQMDAASTDSTVTDGALDINYDSVTNGAEGVNVKATMVAGGGGGEVVSGIVLDVDDDSDAAGTVIGLDIDSSDATGSSDVVGIRLGSTLEDQVSATVGAANQFAVIDANSAANTNASGVVDLDYSTVTNGAAGMNIDMVMGDAGAGVTAHGVLVDLDDDTSSNAANIYGFSATSSDLTGQANTVVAGFYTSGCDAALQADNGYVRIGTGSTPDVTPSDDDLYVEGTIEVDGATRLDGAVTLNSDLYLSKGGDIASPAGGELDLTTGSFFDITGTNNITSIAAADSIAGRMIILQFDGALTFTDGNNLKLAGNFSTTADDTITLICDGTNWWETSRSAN